MSTVSFRLDEEDYKSLQDYVSANNLNLSSFIRDTIMKKIEDDLKINEKYILNACKKSFKEPSYDIDETWKILDI